MEKIKEYLLSLLPFLKDKKKTLWLTAVLGGLYWIQTQLPQVFHLGDGVMYGIDTVAVALAMFFKWVAPTGRIHSLHKWTFYLANGAVFVVNVVGLVSGAHWITGEVAVLLTTVTNGILEGYNYLVNLGLAPKEEIVIEK
jgi:hypothetical protein